MSRKRLRGFALAAALILAGPLVLSGVAGQAASARRTMPADDSAQVVLDWERTLLTAVYQAIPGIPSVPIPNGVPILGVTSMAMYDAAASSARRGRSSETAAVAQAAHDVLVQYFPTGPRNTIVVDALAASLMDVEDKRALTKGIRLGQEAAAAMLASRMGDGYGNPDVHYTLPAGVAGIWQPSATNTDMLGAWIGSLRPLVVDPHTAAADGPDPLTSAAYAADYNEVRRLGSTNSADRTQDQKDTALFFVPNAVTQLDDALIANLEAHPARLDVVETAHLFAAMHASLTDSLIQCWQLKRDAGFWRPSEAITSTLDDGNPATVRESGWTPLVPNPNYSDYVSGHGCVTSSQVQVIREMLGEETTLVLRSGTFPPREYTQLAQLEHDAFHARIWSGLHFRDAMVDAYVIGHDTAERVLDALG
jgi:hypothetical protein